MVFSAGARNFSVLIVATDRAALGRRQATIQAFLDSLRVTAQPGGVPGRAMPASKEPSTTGRPLSPATRFIFDVPAGWNRTEISGLVTLVRVEDLGFGKKNEFRIISLAPERSAGNPIESFQALWNKHVAGVFVTSMHPLPVRVRLRTGATLLYDGNTMRLRQNNAEVTGFLYAVVDGDMIAPFLGVFTGWDQALDRALRPFFDSVRIPGGTGQAKPLFARQELVGVWRSSSTSLANWVDTAGNYRGDASVATGDTLTLRADGTYQSQFAAIGGGRTMRQNDTGTFDVEDDFLVLRPGAPGQGITRCRGRHRSLQAESRRRPQPAYQRHAHVQVHLPPRDRDAGGNRKCRTCVHRQRWREDHDVGHRLRSGEELSSGRRRQQRNELRLHVLPKQPDLGLHELLRVGRRMYGSGQRYLYDQNERRREDRNG
jgi:hypothetical protein